MKIIRIAHQKKTASLDTFQNRVNVDFTVSGGGSIFVNPLSKDVILSYTIELEYRSFGIKGAGISLNDTISIAVEVENAETGATEEREISVDLSKIPMNVTTSEYGATYVSGPLSIWLNPDLTVDYKRSELDVIK
jgi:hypothetical protein